MEDPAQNRAAFVRSGQQQALEVALRDHADLGELIARQADFVFDILRRAPIAGGHMAVRPGEHGLCRLARRAFAAFLLPLIFRRAAHGIALPAQGKLQLHKRILRRLGVFAAQHGAAALLSAGLAIEREGDRIKDRGLARARVARDQIKPPVAKARKLNRRLPGIRAKRRNRQPDRSHASPSQIRSIILVSSSRCSCETGAPFCISCSASNSASGERSSAASRVKSAAAARVLALS